MMKNIFMLMALFGILRAATGCNTFHGIGKDIERAGQKTQEAADAVKKKM
jgi:predicted small secreted protein